MCKRQVLKLANVGLGLRPNPFALVTRAPGPPALTGKAIAFADDKHREWRRTFFVGKLVDFIQCLAHCAHFWPGEAKAKV